MSPRFLATAANGNSQALCKCWKRQTGTYGRAQPLSRSKCSHNLVCYYWHRSAQSGWNGKRQGGKWVGRRGNGGKVPLGQLFLMMSVGCMQREVQIGRRRAEIFAKNSKIKTRTAAIYVPNAYNWPRALQTLLKDEPTCEPFFVGAEARPCRVWGLPAASTARGVGRGPATQLEVGRGRPLCRRQPTKHVVAPLQGCAAAHATHGAHLT